MEPADHSRASFTASVALCLEASDQTFLLCVGRLLELVAADPLLERCLHDAVLAGSKRAEVLRARDAVLRKDLRKLRKDLQQRFPGLQRSAALTHSDADYEDSLADFDAVDSQKENPPVSDDATDDPGITHHLADILVTVTGGLLKPRRKSADVTHAKEAALHARQLRKTRQTLFEDLRDLHAVNPGATWFRLHEIVKKTRAIDVDLRTIGENRLQILAHLLRHEDVDVPSIRRVMYKVGSIYGDAPTKRDLDRFSRIRTGVAERLRIVQADLLWRLNVRVSREWAIRRYVQRCVKFRAEELRQLVRRQEGKPEETLVADAAGYLFDQGLDVWTEVTLGAQRMDLASGPGPGAFVVEGKIYRTPSKGKKAVFDGLKQLNSYVTTLQPTLSAIEGFLLVYRLEGRKLELPRWVLRNSRRFWLIHVDLGESKDTGHNAKLSVPVTAADLGIDELGPLDDEIGRGSQRARGKRSR
jgi:hypothetical protein